MAMYAEIFRMSSFWRTLTCARLALRASDRRSRKFSISATTRSRWSWTSRKYSRNGTGHAGRDRGLEPAERLDERLDVAVEVEHLPLQLEDALGRVDAAGALVGEDIDLDLPDVVVEAADHRLVVVDDAVDDRVQDRHRPVGEQLGLLLESLADLGQRRSLPVAHRHDVLGADEQLDLGELDGLEHVDVARPS